MQSLEERQYKQLGKLAGALHLPVIEAFLTLEVFDKDGRLLRRHRQRSHSWVRNAYNIMFCQLAGKNADDDTFGAGKLSARDTGGIVRYGFSPVSLAGQQDIDQAGYGYRAVGGSDLHGIQVGSGTNAESFEDYALQTLIDDGVGAGELSYVESDAHSITYTAGTKTLKNELARYFNNNSGGTVTVNEVALCGRGYVGGYYYLLTSRDKLASAVNIPDTGQLKVTYTIQLVYPS